MKRIDYLLDAVADIDNLRLAFWKARKGKSYSADVNTYRSDLTAHLSVLRADILRGSVEVGNYRYFKIYDPKERQICASAFHEQVLHHALMNVCHPYFERVHIYDSYASRKDKGTYAAVARAKDFTHRYRFFLKLDVRKFFDSIHHLVLKQQLDNLFKDRFVLGIFDKIIDSYEASPDRGVPIGNLTSQYFANHYLTGLDHFIKERLGIKAYVRYMDDMILWHDDKDVLKQAHRNINDFVENRLKMTLKPELLNYSTNGLPFLGYLIFPHHIRLTQRSKQRFIKKMHYIEQQYVSEEWSDATCQRHALPLIAFTEHADTLGFRRKLKEKGQFS